MPNTWPSFSSTTYGRRYRAQYRMNAGYRRDSWSTLGSAHEANDGGPAWLAEQYPPPRNFALRIIDTQDEDVVVFYSDSAGVISVNRLTPAETETETETGTGTGELKNVIKVGVHRVGGKLMLLVNAKDFHSELDNIGVAHGDGEYLDQPAASSTVANSSFQMSPRMLLTRDYKEVEIRDAVTKELKKVPVTATANLSGIWTTPPSFEQLKKLCNSAHDTARKILEHYQPIDISVEIQKKLLK